MANRILKLKHARFGSIDRESNFLVDCVGEHTGKIQLLKDDNITKETLNASTARSTKFAVLVMHTEQKAQASRLFATPLVFSIDEAKGLEYENIVLYNFVNDESSAFKQISQGVKQSDLDVDSLSYSRAKDKSDKSLETYKFYINALYVAVTRATTNLYVVEGNHHHPLLALLDLERFSGDIEIEKQASSVEEWQKEAVRLEQQGKLEQAQNIRHTILSEQAVPWTPLTGEALSTLRHQALEESNKKAQLLLLEYSVMNQCHATIEQLSNAGFKAATQAQKQPSKTLSLIYKKHGVIYDFKHVKGLEREISKYGINHRTRFNFTPLMMVTTKVNLPQIHALAEMGADNTLWANNGLNAWQMYLGAYLQQQTPSPQEISQLHPLLAPSSVSIQVDGKLEKLDEHSMYGFLLNVFISLWYDYLPNQLVNRSSAFTAADLKEMLDTIPDNVLSPMKKKQTYISRYLSSNECTKEGQYNKKLFYRIKRGHYVLNPALKFKNGDQWVSLRERLDPMQWAPSLPEAYFDYYDSKYLQRLQHYQKSALEHHQRFYQDDEARSASVRPKQSK